MSKVVSDEQTIKRLLERGVEEVIEKEHLEARLKSGAQLRVKLGIDPTAKDLHLGHTVVLRKLRQFQDAGHQAVFIIGDYTAMIGDPSGKNELRPALTEEQIKENMRDYLAEAGKIIDLDTTEVRHNSEWYKPMTTEFFMDLARRFTVARILERDDFQKRLKSDQDISLMEILYPILQGYDSLEVKADLELGGTDQKFNLLMGRKVQKRYGQPEQDIITMPLLKGLDGVKKMSKSLGNYIGLSETPENMFGKIMSIPDNLIEKYFSLLTDISEAELVKIKTRLTAENPKTVKEELGFEIVKIYWGQSSAERTRNTFQKTFSEGQLPDNIPEIEAKPTLLQTISEAGLAPSISEGKRLMNQGAVSVNGIVVKRWDQPNAPHSGDIIKVGSHTFRKIR